MIHIEREQITTLSRKFELHKNSNVEADESIRSIETLILKPPNNKEIEAIKWRFETKF